MAALSATRAAMAAGPEPCSYCKRSVYVIEVENVHATEWNEQQTAWERCMQDNIATLSKDPESGAEAALHNRLHGIPPPADKSNTDLHRYFGNPAIYRAAEERCRAHDRPIPEGVMPKTSVTTRIAAAITSPCLHLNLDSRRAEYRMEATFAAGLQGAGQDEQGRNIVSLFRIMLFHDETNELIKAWETRRHNNLTALHYNRMFENNDAPLRVDRNLEPYLRAFEKRPAKASFYPDCRVTLPDKELSLKLQDIRDDEGEASREFNRLIVCATEGTISSGSEWNAGPDCRVLRVGTGALDIQYRSPDRCDVTDTIRVYNSCDSLAPSKLPLSQTKIGALIAEGEVKTICDPTGSVLEDRHRSTTGRPGHYAERSADIPLRVDWDADPPAIAGEAEAIVNSVGECTLTFRVVPRIHGEVVCAKGEPPVLRLNKHSHQPAQARQCCSYGNGRSRCMALPEFSYDGWGGFGAFENCTKIDSSLDEQFNILLQVKDGSSFKCSGFAGTASVTLRLQGSASRSSSPPGPQPASGAASSPASSEPATAPIPDRAQTPWDESRASAATWQRSPSQLPISDQSEAVGSGAPGHARGEDATRPDDKIRESVDRNRKLLGM